MKTEPTKEVDKLVMEDDFEYLTRFLPEGWEEKAKELGALRRCRKIPGSKELLRALLLHLGEGCSLRETSMRLKEGGLLDISDVAIMDRLKMAGAWFSWMNQNLMAKWVKADRAQIWGGKGGIRVADGTRIQEPGPTGSGWMVHYAIDLATLQCRQVSVKDWADSGEGFGRFKIEPGELWIGDRAYGKKPGINHVVSKGAKVLVRFAHNALPMLGQEGSGQWNLFAHLRKLKAGKTGDWDVVVECESGPIRGRVCAIRKTRHAAAAAVRKAHDTAVKNQDRVLPATLEAAHYLFVFTTLDRDELDSVGVLETYRGRWQIEMVFKRLKSVIGFGHLPKYDPLSVRAWIEGKLLVAFLVEALLIAGASFFPWGYPLASSKPRV